MRLLCVLLLLLVLVDVVVGDACTALAQGDLSGCANLRASCHYDLHINRCATGAPTQCAEFISDSTGCSGSGFGCTYKTAMKLCYKTPPVCTTIVTQVSCGLRSDCKWNTGPQTCTASGTGTCASQTTQPTCVASSCYWDTTFQICYQSKSEVTSVNSCASWSPYPLPNTACTAHDCILDTTGLVCMNPNSGIGNTSSVEINLKPKFVNWRVVQNTLTVEVDVWIPNVIRVYPARYTYITIGGGVTGYKSSGGITADPLCNNIGSYNYSIPPPSIIGVTDPVGLQNYLNSFITTTHTLAFPASNLTFGAVLIKALGDVRAGPGLFVRYVALSPDSLYVVHTVSKDLTALIANCSKLGAFFVQTAASRYYSSYMAVMERDNLNSYVQTISSFYVDVTQAGAITVGSTSTIKPILTISELTTVASACPAGQALIHIVYTLQIQNVFTANTFVGPRNTSDVKFSTPAFPGPYNCYREKVVSVSLVGCFQSSCFMDIGVETGCTDLIADGSSFNNCSYAAVGDAARNNHAFDRVHNFWLDLYNCPYNQVLSNNFKNCTLDNISPQGYPEAMQSVIDISVFPQTTIHTQLDVSCGLLPTPFTSDLTMIERLFASNNQFGNFTSVFDPVQQQLQWDAVLTLVVYMSTYSQFAAIADVHILFTEDLYLVPLDHHGVVIAGGKVLYWADIKAYLLFVPKDMQRSEECVDCAGVPGIANLTAFDGFSISVITLRALSPANGYELHIPFFYDLPIATITAPNGLLDHHEHQHLQTVRRHGHFTTSSIATSAAAAPSHHTTTMSGGSPQDFDVQLLIDDTTNPSPVEDGVQNATSAPLKSLQVQLRLYVDSGSGADITNSHSMAEFIAQRLPLVIAQAYQVNAEQITNLNVLLDHQRLLRHKKWRVMTISSQALFVSFVLIPSPIANATALPTLSQITMSSSLAALQSLLVANGMVLDSTTSIQVITVFVAPNEWYITTAAHSQVVVSEAAPDVGAAFIVTMTVIGLVSAIGCMLLLYCLVRCMRNMEGYDSVAAVVPDS